MPFNLYLYFHFYIRPYFANAVCISVLIIPLILTAFAAYAYIVNLKRPSDDPDKREYRLLAILLTPFTLYPILLLAIIVFILRALLFACFLGIFTVVLVLLRKPFLLVWLDKLARKIGDPLLKINTRLIEIALSPWKQGPRAA